MALYTLDAHFGELLNSQAAEQIIANKLSKILEGPEGFVLLSMGADMEEVKTILQYQIRAFIADISPTVSHAPKPYQSLKFMYLCDLSGIW